MTRYECEVRVHRPILQFREYLEFARELEKLEGPCRVLVDLGKTRFAHPSGMAPIVAVIRHLTEAGWEFDVALPETDFLCDYFDKAGWTAGITDSVPASPQAVPGSTYVPLTRYTSAAELNPLINDIVTHFSRHDVFGPGVLDAIAWSTNEVADNVLLHAGGVCGWIQLASQPKKNLIEIVIVDCGQGITSSLRERYPELADDAEAVRLAAEKGVTRNPNVGQGNGLAGTLRIAISGHGWANIVSGHGLLRYSPPPRAHRSHMQTGKRFPSGVSHGLAVERGPFHQGTVVSLTLPTAEHLDVTSALWGSRPLGALEESHLLDGGEFAIFRVADEATGFGNRESARPLRQRLHNLLNMFADSRIIVSFEGVSVVSASFTDEFIARLVKEVGVATFFQRVMLRDMNDLIRSTVDAVVEQRLRS